MVANISAEYCLEGGGVEGGEGRRGEEKRESGVAVMGRGRKHERLQDNSLLLSSNYVNTVNKSLGVIPIYRW